MWQKDSRGWCACHWIGARLGAGDRFDLCCRCVRDDEVLAKRSGRDKAA